MKSFFTPNLEKRGRIARAVTALLLLLAGGLIFSTAWWAAVFLWVAGAFTAFEAARGWCVLRACGIKTKM